MKELQVYPFLRQSTSPSLLPEFSQTETASAFQAFNESDKFWIFYFLYAYFTSRLRRGRPSDLVKLMDVSFFLFLFDDRFAQLYCHQ